MTQRLDTRWKWQFGLMVGVLLLELLQFRGILFLSDTELIQRGLISDDAFFFLTIARRLVAGDGFSFDGVMPTNGFQFLWLCVSTLLVWSFEPSMQLEALWYTSIVFYLLFSLLVVRYLTLIRTPLALTVGVCAGILLNAGFQRLVLNGQEVALTLLILAILLNFVESSAQALKSTRTGSISQGDTLVGCLAGVLVLARTDLIVVSLMMIVTFWLRTRRPIASAASLFLPFAAIVVAYVGFNLYINMTPVPISGLIKQAYLSSEIRSLAAYWRSTEWHGLFVAFHILFPLTISPVSNIFFIAVISVVFLIAALLLRKFSTTPVSVIGFTIGILVHIAMMYGYHRELRPYSAYYFVPELLWVLIGSSFLLSRCRWFSAHILFLVSMVIIAFIQWPERHLATIPYWEARLELSRSLPSVVPDGQPIGAFWPGIVSYVSQRQVIPLDGLVGSYDYFVNYVQRGAELEYLRSRNGRYLVMLLRKDREKYFGKEPPLLTSWSEIGERALWTIREHPWKIVLEREIQNTDASWVLIEIDWDNHRSV